MILQRYESVVMKNMMDLETKKEQEIKNMVTILEQIDLPDIILLTRDANTLLMRQKEAELQNISRWKIMTRQVLSDYRARLSLEKRTFRGTHRTKNSIANSIVMRI